MARRKSALAGTRSHSASPEPHVIVGLAHVVIGAMRVLQVILLTLISDRAPGLSFVVLLSAALATGTVLGGLWLSDRKRRGVVVSLILDVAGIVAIVLFSKPWSLFDLAVLAALAASVVWVAPRIEVEREAAARSER